MVEPKQGRVGKRYGVSADLIRTLVVAKEEELVLFYRPAEVSSVLRSLPRDTSTENKVFVSGALPTKTRKKLFGLPACGVVVYETLARGSAAAVEKKLPPLAGRFSTLSRLMPPPTTVSVVLITGA